VTGLTSAVSTCTTGVSFAALVLLVSAFFKISLTIALAFASASFFEFFFFFFLLFSDLVVSATSPSVKERNIQILNTNQCVKIIDIKCIIQFQTYSIKFNDARN